MACNVVFFAGDRGTIMGVLVEVLISVFGKVMMMMLLLVMLDLWFVYSDLLRYIWRFDCMYSVDNAN